MLAAMPHLEHNYDASHRQQGSLYLIQTANFIVYAVFQNVLEIDRNRNVFYDYTTLT